MHLSMAEQVAYELRNSNPFQDTLMNDVIKKIRDSISEAWNGWEQAVKFQDEEKMCYYMIVIKNLCEVEIKLVKLNKH